MQSAALPDNESARLAALDALDVLDTAAEAEFDALVHTASLVCDVPISLISLVDSERQWFKANAGLPGASETPRDIAFCSHAILDSEVFEVQDALHDPRFADNPLVAGRPDIRFYAGAPLQLSDGSRVGTLCVIDREPRRLSALQREVLRSLALIAARALEGRRALRNERRATSELATSEARFRVLSDSSPHGVFHTDAQGQCTYTNTRWQAIYGLTLQQSLGSGWSQTLHQDDRAMVWEAWARASDQRQRFDLEFRVRRPDGEVRQVHSRAQPTFDAHGGVTGYVGSVEDVTEHLGLVARLAASEESLRWMYESTPAMLHAVDQEGRLTMVSDAWLAKLGYTREEVLGRRSVDFFTEASRQYALTEHLPCLMAEGRHGGVHFQMVSAAGEVIDVLLSSVVEYDKHANPNRIVAVLEDVTLRWRAEAALRHAQDLLDRTGRLAGVGGWEVDVATNQLTWTDETYRIHGLPRDYQPKVEAAIGFYAPEARPLIQAAVESGLQGGPDWDLELPLIRADGERIWVRAVGSVEFADGKPTRLVGAFKDVTKVRSLTDKLAEEHELLQVTLKSIGDAVITADVSGHVVWLNPVAERMTGWLSAEAHGRPLTQVFHIVNEDTRAPTENPVATCLAQGKVVGLANHTVLISRDGVEYGIEDSAAPIRNDRGEMLGVVLVFHDVTESRRLSGEMSYRATHDALTGLVNRAEFETRLRRVLHSAHEERSEHALMYIDLDQFKLVNDACGHAVGDQLLQQVSKLLGDSIRARDTLARLGGDEFAVILERCNAEQALRVAQQICERMEDFRFVHDGRRFRIGASIGLVPVDQRWQTTAAILQAADTSCYAAKEAGRNRVHAWYDTDLAMRARHGEMQWASRIEQALDDNRFVLHAQRIEALQHAPDGLRAEVLLRMLDANGAVVPPGAFLPAAERFHLASRIDRWVLRHVLDWMHAAPSLAHLKSLSVNLSGQSIGDRAFHRWAIEVLTTSGRPMCERLCLEITETAAVTNMADAALFVEQVRALGVQVALDDFGAGASSFGYLKNLQVDYLKIDGQFITDLIEDPLDEAAVRCFVDVAKTLGVKTVAEFVARADVRVRLLELSVDFAQGYLFHKPAPIDELLGLALLTT